MASFASITLFAVLWLSWAASVFATVSCPHCSGNFPSCKYATDGKCPTVDQVVSNVAVIAAGVGALSLTGLIRPRFLRMFSRVSFDTLLALVKRTEPGTSFTITASTTPQAIMTAVANGMTTMDQVLITLVQLIDEESDAGKAAKLSRRLDCLKLCADIKASSKGRGGTSGSSLFDSGILTYIWAKVSNFVMEKGMQIKLNGGEGKSDSSASDLSAKLSRPVKFSDFAEMMNLFIMFVHGLGVASCMAVTDFYEHVVWDTIRYRGESWQLAHELLLVMFRRIEDSGGKLTLGSVVDETYLNTVMAEAEANRAMFFRTPGGNPGNVNQERNGGKVDESRIKSNPDPNAGCCVAFNIKNGKHGAKQLNADGTCRFRHVCNHWVKNKGANGRCMGSEGTPGHAAWQCDNPNKCDSPVA
jgi:hypothetical protein